MSQRFAGFVLTLAVVVLAAPAVAQEAGQMPEMTPEQQAMMEAYQAAGAPGAPHQAMAAMAGNYTTAVKSWHEPNGEPMEESGTVTRTMVLDGRVMVEDFHGTMMGTPFTGHGMMGYDNVSGKHWSIWTDSMSTGVMVSQGSCDEEGSCTFSGTWNDPIAKGPVTARLTTRWTSPTTQIFEMHGPGPDGAEMKMMEITYTKQ
ncbi:MAG: DUF1579 domain-containing protein [Thermoanaerobaculia bacterium]